MILLFYMMSKSKSFEVIQNIYFLIKTSLLVLFSASAHLMSLTNSLQELKENLDKICEALKLPKFARTEMEFLAEYKATVEPLAITLDGLQGDEHCYYGMLLPKLTQLRYRLEKLQMSTLQYCGALVNALLVGLTTRFNSFGSWRCRMSSCRRLC